MRQTADCRLGQAHRLVNQRRSNFDDLILGAEVELKSSYQGIKARLINIALTVTPRERRDDFNSRDDRYVEGVSRGWIAYRIDPQTARLRNVSFNHRARIEKINGHDASGAPR